MRLRIFGLAFVIVAFAVVCATSVRHADAHQTSVSRSKVTLSDDKTKLTYQLSYDTRDMQEALKQRSNNDAERAKQTEANVFALLQEQILVKTNRECRWKLESSKDVGVVDKTAVVVWTIDCGGEILDLTIDYQLFYDIDDAHTSVLSPREGGKKLKPYLFKKGGAPYRWNATNWLLFVRFGMEHIAFGFDHVFFLLALLLVALLGRRNMAGASTTSSRVPSTRR